MYHPLPITHRKGVILRYLQIVHHCYAQHNLPPGDNPNTSIGMQDMHPDHDLCYWQEPVFQCKERMLLVGMHHFTALSGRLAMLRGHSRGQCQVHQVIVTMHPHMLDGLQFHLMCLGIVCPDLVTLMQRTDGSLSMVGCHHCFCCEATATTRLSQCPLFCIRSQEVIAQSRF